MSVSNNDHRCYEAEVYPNSGQPLEYKNSVTDLLMDSSWKFLDTELIQILLSSHDSDASIKSAVHIHNTSLFAGGIQFAKKDGSSKLNANASRWYDSTWTQWATNILRHQDAIGWVAASHCDHYLYVGCPTILDLSQVTILFKMDVFSRPHFVFLENTGNGQDNFMFQQIKKHHGLSSSIAHQGSSMYRYIPNIVVYIENSPSSDGSFNSKIAVLAADIEMESLLYEATKTATRQRANPNLILESVSEKYDKDAVTSVIQPMQMSMLGNGNTPYNGGSSSSSSSYYNGLSEGAQKELETKKYEYSQALSLMGSGGLSNATDLARDHIRAIAAQGIKEHYVSSGKRVVNTHLAESPNELYINAKTNKLEKFFLLKGIPLVSM